MTRRKKLPIALSEDEQEQLLRVPNRRYPTGERNFVFLLTALDTGLRLSELIALEWRHIDLLATTIDVVDGKGGKDRRLFLTTPLVKALGSWRARQAKLLDTPPERVFTSLRGKPMCKRYLQEMVPRYGQKAGLEKRVTPHTLRHSFATSLLRDSKNIIYVQNALGHAHVLTTMIYTHLVDEDLREAMVHFRDKRKA